MTYNTSAIVPENFVLIRGYWYHIETAIDSDGFFFASDTEGEEFEFNGTDVEDVMEVL